MSIKIRTFNTEKEAEAFAQGVSFVNDSAILVKGIQREGTKWGVVMEDSDG